MIRRLAASNSFSCKSKRQTSSISAHSMQPASGTVSSVVKGNVMVPNETEAQKLLRAKGYPYARPDTSFIFVRGEVFEFDNAQWSGLNHLHEIVGRDGSSASEFAAARGLDLVRLSREEQYWPVLAIGSNAGPEQLRRKYPEGTFPDCLIPVVQVALEDFDVVYTPYIASYGSCTATLEHSPGTVTSIFITYLTTPLMEHMHSTEGGYNLCRLSGLRLHVAPREPEAARQPGGSGSDPAAEAAAALTDAVPGSSYEVRDWVYQYNHKLGCIDLPLEGRGVSPVAIAAIPARRRIFPAVGQVEMLSALRAALGSSSTGPLTPVALPGSGSAADGDAALDEWILNMVRSSRARQRACSTLAEHARAFSYPLCEVVASL